METNKTTEYGWFGGWIFRLVVHLILLLVGTAFLALLFAPMLKSMFERPLIRKYAVYPNYEELVRTDMRPIKITLWTLCGIAWAILIGLNLYRP